VVGRGSRPGQAAAAARAKVAPVRQRRAHASGQDIAVTAHRGLEMLRDDGRSFQTYWIHAAGMYDGISKNIGEID